MAIGTPSSGFAESFAALARMQKPARGVSLYSSRINRPAGRFLAALAARAGATPNQVTLLGLVFSLTAIGLIVATPASLLTAVLLGPLLVVSFALDSADGQLARLQGSGGPAGEWLDHMVDAGVKLTLHLAIVVAWFQADRPGRELLLPLAFQVVAVLMFLAVTLGGMLRSASASASASAARSAGAGQARVTVHDHGGVGGGRAGVRRPGLRAVVLLPVDYGALCLLFLIWAWPAAFRIGYAALLAAQLTFLIAFAIGLYRELSRSGALEAVRSGAPTTAASALATSVRHQSLQSEESSS
jgi:phosphatidylglycerophosphate synthase